MHNFGNSYYYIFANILSVEYKYKLYRNIKKRKTTLFC